MKTTVIYHSADFDGIFCREIAKKFIPDAELIGWNHGDPKIPAPDGQFYILDLSPECLVDGVGDAFERCIWIDHHKSSIEKYNPLIAGYRIDGVAACRLAWQWFAQSISYAAKLYRWDVFPVKQAFIDRKVTEPYAVQLAGEFDIWDKRNPDAEALQMGLRSQKLTAQTWERLLNSEVPEALRGTGMEVTESENICRHLINQGACLQYAKTAENKEIITAAGFDLEFEGLKFIACNHARYNSFLFTAGLKPEHDACLGFAWRAGKWTVSLYHAPGKEHHDLSKIAVKHGGGGHRGACGFVCKTLPFELA